jgi:hypothetical protein
MTPADMLTAVEADHPAIAARIAAIWGEPECGAYLRRLLIQDREARDGFGISVFAALAGMLELHDMLYPVRTASDVWRFA